MESKIATSTAPIMDIFMVPAELPVAGAIPYRIENALAGNTCMHWYIALHQAVCCFGISTSYPVVPTSHCVYVTSLPQNNASFLYPF